MKKFIYLVLTLAVMSACDKAVVEDEGYSQDRSLKVSVRAPEGDAVSYPLILYAFQNDLCCGMKTIASSSEALELSVGEGQCSVYAISGADEANYLLPEKENALPESLVTLREGKAHGDLSMAGRSVTVSGGQTEVALDLERKVLLLEGITIRQIPTSATAVSVRLHPLGKSVSLDGNTVSGATSFESELTRQADGTWRNTAQSYLLPLSQNVSVTVSITAEGNTRHYTYACPKPLIANHHLSIEGTFTGSAGVRLTVTVTAPEWGSDQTLSFDFGETEDSGAEPSPEPAPTPVPTPEGMTVIHQELKVGDIYKGCYVLEVGPGKATLLSPHQQSGLISETDNEDVIFQEVEQAVAPLGVEGISGWRVMDREEAVQIFENKRTINTALADAGIATLVQSGTYFVKEGEEMKKLDLSKSVLSISSFAKNSTYLRPVATVAVAQ